MKKKIFIFIIFLVVFIPIKSYGNLVKDVFSYGDSFIESSDSVVIDDTQIAEVSKEIFDFLIYIGIGISILMGAIIGINIMIASAEEKAKIKEMLFPYIIGCIVIFGAFTIWKITIELFNI